MSLQVVTIESDTGCEIYGVYLTEKLAKLGLNKLVEGEVKYKRKLGKSETAKRLVYQEDTKELTKKSVYMTSVLFEMPVTKGKKVKDPLAPKKGLSGFMMYSNEHRNRIKGENPEATFGDVGRLVGEAWKSLDESAKSVYTKKSESEKARYLRELAVYQGKSVVEPELVSEVVPVKKVRAKKAA